MELGNGLFAKREKTEELKAEKAVKLENINYKAIQTIKIIHNQTFKFDSVNTKIPSNTRSILSERPTHRQKCSFFCE